MIEGLRTWNLEAARLVNAVTDFACVDEVAVGARATAAVTLRDFREGVRRHADDARLAVDKQRLLTLLRFIDAAMEVIDPGGACTQEIEDDAKNAARRSE